MRDMADNESGYDNRDIARRRIKKCLEHTLTMNPDFADFWERTGKLQKIMVWIGRNVLMLEGLGEPKKTFDADDFESRKLISPFDFVKSVTDTKENLIVDDWSEKQYNAFIVNKSLSHGQDTVVAANEMNARPHIDPKLQYDFLRGIIRKKRRFNKWLKAEKEEHIEIVKEYFGYNNVKAMEALRILRESDIEQMKSLIKKGGKNA